MQDPRRLWRPFPTGTMLGIKLTEPGTVTLKDLQLKLHTHGS